MNFFTALKVWGYYCLPMLPGTPAVGDITESDCRFVQAFGRNDFTDSELGKRLWELREKAELDDTKTFTLLAYRDFEPGKWNRTAAKRVMRKMRVDKKPCEAQWEVAYAMYLADPQWYLDHQLLIDCIWPPKEGYFATYHVKLFSKEAMQRRGCSRPEEIAHPAMVARAIPIIWKIGLDPVTEGIPWWRVSKHELWIWDEDSVQWWTATFFRWLIREIPGRAHHIYHGLVALCPRRTG